MLQEASCILGQPLANGVGVTWLRTGSEEEALSKWNELNVYTLPLPALTNSLFAQLLQYIESLLYKIAFYSIEFENKNIFATCPWGMHTMFYQPHLPLWVIGVETECWLLTMAGKGPHNLVEKCYAWSYREHWGCFLNPLRCWYEDLSLGVYQCYAFVWDFVWNDKSVF